MVELEDEAEVPVPDEGLLVQAEAGEVAALEPGVAAAIDDLPSGGSVQEAQQIEEGALAHPGVAQDGQDLPGQDREVDAPEDWDRVTVDAVLLLEADGLDQGRCARVARAGA